MKGDRLTLGLLIGVLSLLGWSEEAIAQVGLVPDTAVGRSMGTTVQRDVIPNFDSIRGGTQVGRNLFHSFREFNIGEGRMVYFLLRDATIQNIFARVTGSNRSEILGTLNVRNFINGSLSTSNSNLYLINPNGILFGPNARLDVGASFVGTTANAIEFGDRGSFSATTPGNGVSRLTINPSAYLFSQVPTGTIVNRSAARDVGLRVPNGQSLTLLGGDVAMPGGRLSAFGGRVELGAVAAPGRVAIVANGALGFGDALRRGTVALTNGAQVDARLRGGGEIGITAGDIGLEGSFLRAGIDTTGGTATSRAGDVRLDATGTIRMAASSGIFNILADGMTGNAGDVQISGNVVQLTGGSQLDASTSGTGNAGNIVIRAIDRVIFQKSAASSRVEAKGRGQGGNVVLFAKSLDMRDGSQISTSTFGQGDAGDIQITVSGKALFDGFLSNLVSDDVTSGLRSNVFQRDTVQQSGKISLDVGSLEITNRAQIQSVIFGRGQGKPININVREAAVMDGSDTTGVFTRLDEGAEGSAGNIGFSAKSLTIKNKAQLGASTQSFGNGGNIAVQITDDLRLENGGSITSNIAETAVGTGGSINVRAGSLYAKNTNGSALQTATFGYGNSGNITVNVRDTIKLEDLSLISTSIKENARGNAGNITINTKVLEALRFSGLLSGTNGNGNAGSIITNAQDYVLLQTSAIFSDVGELGRGNGGNVEISTRSLEVRDGTQLITNTKGTGDAGNVRIRAIDRVLFQNSNAFSGVTETGTGKGGNVEIDTAVLEVRDGAQLIANTSGAGDAGNVRIRAIDRVVLDGVDPTDGRSSAILTNNGTPNSTVRQGRGGNVTVTAPLLVVRNGAVIDARTANDRPGGDITLTVGTVTLLNGGQISSNSNGSGPAGTLNLTATDRINISGSDTTYTDRLARNGTRVAPVSPNSGLYVRSSSTGSAGNIIISSPRVTLDNQGRIDAQSSTVTGGNIILTIPKLLLLRNGSQISATAGTANPQAPGTGGTVEFKGGFIVAIPNENSDITANATQGRGGTISINSPGIFGLKFRPKLTEFSDITASSEAGINGTVNLNTPDNSGIQNGLDQLPKSLIDTDKLISQSCIVRKDKPQGTFYILGKTNLPQRPGDLIPSNYSTQESTTQIANRPWQKGDPIVEPTGFYKLANGRLVMSRECDR